MVLSAEEMARIIEERVQVICHTVMKNRKVDIDEADYQVIPFPRAGMGAEVEVEVPDSGLPGYRVRGTAHCVIRRQQRGNMLARPEKLYVTYDFFLNPFLEAVNSGLYTLQDELYERNQNSR